MQELSPHIVASIAGAVIGIALGAVVQRTNFCAMGAVSDLVLFQNWNRLRAWFLAMAVAVLGTQLLVWAELIDLGQSIYLGSRLTWAGSIVGGLLFGIGMVLAGGCGNRNLVRFGAGDLRSMVVVLVMGLSAGMTLYGLIAYLRVELNDATALELADHGVASQGLPDLLAAAIGTEAGSVQLGLGLALAAAVAVFCFSSAAFRRSPRNIVGGLAVGALVVAGWWATGVLAFDEFEPVALGSLTFIAPVGDGVLYLMTFTGSSISFGIALAGGVIAGAFLAALASGSFHLQGFANKSDLERNLIGGVLMGVGGVMALGCTIGQGVTGISTLALGSFLALVSIIAGGVGGTVGDQAQEAVVEGDLVGRLVVHAAEGGAKPRRPLLHLRPDRFVVEVGRRITIAPHVLHGPAQFLHRVGEALHAVARPHVRQDARDGVQRGFRGLRVGSLQSRQAVGCHGADLGQAGAPQGVVGEGPRRRIGKARADLVPARNEKAQLQGRQVDVSRVQVEPGGAIVAVGAVLGLEIGREGVVLGLRPDGTNQQDGQQQWEQGRHGDMSDAHLFAVRLR